ncbi:hypothetical protein COE82_18455 [Bacillus wiedmannii]|uniref:hypothetical protein n=1 Tax=Bacillus wiedmannii TaxID=1890302 RepID=UPI000BFDF072|nr:hypothetical protein [Bacillus wiedmannii]PHB39295.1 hypothetical protein COE82_18455 [Bacillus wiedmannii]
MKKLSKFEFDLLNNRRNPEMSLVRFKYSDINFGEKKYIISKINKKLLPGSSYIFNGILAKNISEINKTKYIPYHEKSSFNHHLEWTALILNLYKEQIEEYLILKNKYSECLLKNEYEQAILELEKINNEISFSLWGIEQSLLCSELMFGMEEKAKQLSSFAQNTKSYMVALLSDFYNYKVELSTSRANFEHKLSTFINELDEGFAAETYKNYLEFQLSNKLYSLKEDTLKQVLSLSATLPIIDLYETFVKICSVVIASNKFEQHVKNQIYSLIEYLKINDYRLDKMLLFSNNVILKEIPMKKENLLCEEIIEQYTIGAYKECISKIQFFEEEFGLNFSIITILVKSAIQLEIDVENIDLKNKLIKDKIIKPVFEIYSCIDKERNFEELLSIAKIFGDLPLRYEIESFYLEYTNAFNGDLFEFSVKFRNLYSYIISPGILLEKVNGISGYMNDFIATKLGYDSTLCLLKEGEWDENIAIPKLRFQYYKAAAFAEKNPEEAIELLNNMLTDLHKEQISSNLYFFNYEKFALKLFSLYMKTFNYQKALDLVVDSFRINESLILRMDKISLFEEIRKGHIVKNDLKLILFMYFVDKENTFEIYSAFVSYVESQNKLIPSELLEVEFETDEERDLLNYIFAHIYNKSVMKHFVYLDPKERSNERILILEHLINQRYGDVILHQKEIKEINKNLSIQKRIKSVDEKKIFVDIEGILKEFEGIYKERFKKYVMLEGLDTDLKYYDLKEELQALSIQFNDEVNLEFQSNPERKFRYLMFKDVIDDFRTEALTNSKYGLGKFLSSRIRHGALENTLTKSFKNHKLLSLKQNNERGNLVIHKDRENEINHHTNSKNSVVMKEIKNKLNLFSQKIVDKIEEIKDWIRIRDKHYQQGMFNYQLMDAEAMVYLYGSLNNITDYNSFYAEITNYFWEVTELNLKDIRLRFTKEIYEYFTECLEELSKDLDALRLTNVDTEIDIISGILLKDINLCKVGIKTDLNEISNWFVVRRVNDFHDFYFQELIDTSLEIIRKSNKDFDKIKITGNVKAGIQIKGEYFNYLVDVFNMLYSNALEHSGFNNLEELMINTEIAKVTKEQIELLLENDPSELGIVEDRDKFKEVFLEESENFLAIHVKNSLSEEKNSEEIRRIIAERIDAAMDIKLISEEGGTGISKLYYICKHNLKVTNYHEYLIDDNNWFHARICINIKNLKV